MGATSAATPPNGWTVARLAAEVGLTSDTVRYYERAGLLPAPPRSASGYRRYDARAVDRLRFIKGAQRLGLRLREIGDLLVVRDTGVCPCEPAGHLLRRRIDEIDAEIARLSVLRAELVAMTERLPSADCPEPEPGTWCPPESFEGGDHGV
jgi:DNA-binding transcriptional MerR regulator